MEMLMLLQNDEIMTASLSKVITFDNDAVMISSFCNSISISIPIRSPLTRDPKAFSCGSMVHI